ncbi:MAG TPA: FUSC family protein [Streptosporangiaceae bacterium]|nr:FUSC family protein [Streptosporangiaceae bacterium]
MPGRRRRGSVGVIAPDILTFRRHRARRIGAAARTVAQHTPQPLTVVRRAQPTAATVARVTSTAVFAYLVALALPVSHQPVLAPLTALLVAQVSLFQTLTSAARRVAAVVAGVLLAVVLSALVGFTWWSLGITIVVALAVGYALRLGDTILEVPISAMLILSVAGSRPAASGRIAETLIGAAAGLLAGLIFARPRVQPATEAIGELCHEMADLLDQIAAGLRDGSVLERSDEWLRRTRSLGGEIGRVDDALRLAEDSMRLNPRGMTVPNPPVSLRDRLDVLEHAAITLRGIARSLADSLRLAGQDSPWQDQAARARLASALGELAEAVRIYGRLAASAPAFARDQLGAELERHLAAAREQQDQLSELLGTDPALRPVGWPLRGEVISHLDRFRTELARAIPGGAPRARRPRSWLRPLQAALPQRRPARGPPAAAPDGITRQD